MLAAARATLDRRIVVAFQPHRYTRTQQLLRRVRPGAGAGRRNRADRHLRRRARSRSPASRSTALAEVDPRRLRTSRPSWFADLDAVVPALVRLGAPGRRRSSRWARARSGRCRERLVEALDRKGGELMPVSAPADKRFRRTHVQPARPRVAAGVEHGAKVAWRSLRSVMRARARARGGRAGDLGARGSSVRTIVVDGQRADGDGRGACACSMTWCGANMLTADLEAWRRRLLASPWVADAAIRRVFPDAVVGRGLREDGRGDRPDRTARSYLIDRTGETIDEFGPSYAEFDLPDHRRPRARPGRAVRAIRRRAASRRAALRRRCSRRPIWRRWCRRSTSADPQRRGAHAERRHRARAHRRRPLRRAAAVVHRRRQQRLREGGSGHRFVDMRYVDGPRREQVFVTCRPGGRRSDTAERVEMTMRDDAESRERKDR